MERNQSSTCSPACRSILLLECTRGTLESTRDRICTRSRVFPGLCGETSASQSQETEQFSSACHGGDRFRFGVMQPRVPLLPGPGIKSIRGCAAGLGGHFQQGIEHLF